jgi:hypothetical protein
LRSAEDQNPTETEEALYHELAYYTLSHTNPRFIHQHAVDVFAAQTADENSNPIKLAFGLIGLFLHIEKNYSGRAVQKAHMQLARQRKTWPQFALPAQRGKIRVADVLRAPPGILRDQAIENWAADVWRSWAGCHRQVAELVASEGI